MMNKPAILGGEAIFKALLPIVSPKLPQLSEIQGEVEEILKTGMVTNFSQYMKKFESKCSGYLNIKESIALANATSGLMLLPKVLDLKGEVITTSFTFHSTAHSLIWNGLKPVFADIDLETFNIDPKEVEKKITDKTCAILATHIFGNPCNIDELEEIAKKHNLYLIFDAAHAFGSKYNDLKIGCFGDAEVFSLSATKLLITGEGGLITTNNGELASKLRLARNYGDPGNYDCKLIGLNSKMQEFSAIIGIKMLSSLDGHVANRNRIVKIIKEELRGVPGLSFQKITENSLSTYKDLAIIVDKDKFGVDRNKFITALTKENIAIKKYFDPPIHLQTVYGSLLDENKSNLPNTEYVSNNVICLPIYSVMEDEIAIKMCQAIKRIWEWRNEIKPKVLVVGGAGYIGSVLSEKLLNKGYDVRVLDQMIFGTESIKNFVNHPKFELITGSIEDQYIVSKAIKGCDVVVHLAGLANDPSCELAPEATERINYLGTESLVKTSKKEGVSKFIFASSSSIYGAAGDVIVTEESPNNPISLYAKAKVRGEELLLREQTSNFTVCSLRKATVYGVSPRMRFDLVVNILTAMGISDKKIVVYGGTQWRPHLHVSDAAEAYIACIEADNEKIAGQTFNVGSENFTIDEIAEMVKEILPDIEIVHFGPTDLRSYRADFTKIQKVLGFRPKMGVRDGINELKREMNAGNFKHFRDLNYYNIKRVLGLGL